MNYYETLGLKSDATHDEIKKAYRKLVLIYHPDRNPSDKNAEAIYLKLNEAYEVLSDPERRKNYDSPYRNKSFPKVQRTQQNQTSSNERKKTELTPLTLLYLFQRFRKKTEVEDITDIHYLHLFDALNKLLSEKNLQFLIQYNDHDTNRKIINEVLQSFNILNNTDVKIISSKLIKLAGSDKEAVQKINSFSEQQQKWNRRTYFIAAAIVSAILLFIFILIISVPEKQQNNPRKKNKGDYMDTLLMDFLDLIDSAEFETINTKRGNFPGDSEREIRLIIHPREDTLSHGN